MAKALIVEILADAKQFGRELDKAAGKTRSMGKVAGVAGLAIAGGLALGLEKSVKSAADFQQSMQLLTTQAGVSEKQLGSLKKGVLELAGPTATAPEELAKGIYHLASQGLRGKKALDALRIAAEGAKVGQADLEDVTNALGATIVSGIKGAQNLNQAMGSLNATVGAGDMRMQDLADAMGTGLLASAHVTGVSLREVDAALAVFGDNNIRGSKAGNLLNSTLRVMSATSGAGARALALAGINANVLNKNLSSKGLIGTLQWLQRQMKQNGITGYKVGQLLTDAFGGRQAQGVRILLDQLKRLEKKNEEVGKGAKSFGEAWQHTSETTKFKFDQMKAAMDSVAINLGSALLPAVTAVANKIAILTGWLAKHNTFAKILVGIVAAVAAGLLTLSASMWAVNIAMDANPIVLVIAALVAFGVALAVAWKSSKTFRDVVTGAWNAIKNVTAVVWPAVKQIIVSTFQSAFAAAKVVINVFKAGWREFGDTIKAVASNDFAAVKGIILGIVQVIRGVVDIVRGIAHGDWAQAWHGMKEVVGGALGAIKALLMGAVNSLAAIMGQTGRSMLRAFTGPINAIISLIKSLISWAEKAIGILEKLSHIHIPNPFHKGGHHVEPGPIPPQGGMASGGIVTKPIFTLVGEAGPEAVIPLSKMGSMGMGSGSSVTVNVGPIYGTADAGFARTLSTQLATQLRNGGAPQLQQAIKAL